MIKNNPNFMEQRATNVEIARGTEICNINNTERGGENDLGICLECNKGDTLSAEGYRKTQRNFNKNYKRKRC